MIFTEQILNWFQEEKGYADRLINDGMTTILKYGIACRKNTCMVHMSKL